MKCGEFAKIINFFHLSLSLTLYGIKDITVDEILFLMIFTFFDFFVADVLLRCRR
jgi:hypothetical protein